LNAHPAVADDSTAGLSSSVVAPLARFYLPLLDRVLRRRISANALTMAESAHGCGNSEAAKRLLSMVACTLPRDTSQLMRAAVLNYRMDNYAAAAESCKRVLQHDPRHEVAFELLSRLELPGEDYLEVLRRIHAALQPRTYVEIGVAVGDSIRLAAPATRAIGVDPSPQISNPLPTNVRIIAATSDEFFAGAGARDALSGTPIDLAFIDGMHHFEFALRDFINIERLSASASTVLIHDCYPLNRLTAERERQTDFWSGDVWRLVVALRRHRPDLKVHTIATPPTGLAVVRGLDQDSNILAERYEAIVAEMLATDFSVLERSKAEMVNRCPNEWEHIAALLTD
jgi:hypothetical protein